MSVAELDLLLRELYGEKVRRGGALVLMHRGKGGKA
jgi:hypothetical protein